MPVECPSAATANSALAANRTSTALVRESVSRGGLWVKIVSNSMAPTVRAGDDVWIVAAGSSGMRAGDPVLIESTQGLVLHRYLYKRSKGPRTYIRITGDAAGALDPLIPMEKVIGVARRVRGPSGVRFLGRAGNLRHWFRNLAKAAWRWATSPNPASLREVTGWLACFPIRLECSEGIEPQTFSRWLRSGQSASPLCRVRMRINPELTGEDPFRIHQGLQEPGELGSSAFRLIPDGQDWRLEVAPSHGDSSKACPNAVENALRLLLLALCERNPGTFLLHAAAVIPPGSDTVWVAPGASGTGKTTLSRLLSGEGYAVLSDDLVVVCRTPDGIKVWGTPFSGDGQDIEKVQGPGRLGGWLALEKAAGHRLLPGHAALLAARIAGAWQRLPAAEPADTGTVLDIAEDLLREGASYNLSFAVEPGLGPYLAGSLTLNHPVPEAA